MDFTEENIRKLFGHEAAEDDDEENLYGFYIKGASYTQLKSLHTTDTLCENGESIGSYWENSFH